MDSSNMNTRRSSPRGIVCGLGGIKLAAIVIVLQLCLVSTAWATTVTTNAVIWRFTARDFLPAGCHRSFANLRRLWDYSTNLTTTNPYNFSAAFPYREYPNTTRHMWRGNDSAYCPLWNDIADGRLNGHPDFETATVIYGDGCSGHQDRLTSPQNGGISCLSLDPSGLPWPNLTKIIEDYLEFDESGIPKPVYCTDPFFKSIGDMRCGTRLTRTLPRLATTTGREQFDVWYRDDPEYNLRVGFRMTLGLNDSTGNYVFASNRPNATQVQQPLPSDLSFHPMNQYANAKPCLATDMRLDCSNGGRIFPFTTLALGTETLYNISFAFTVESHFFFDFEGNETFTFAGDDDFWVFINEKLAVDVGGLHGPIRGKIDLSKPEVQQILGITPGNPYAVDIFHAERHTGLSNFEIETAFRPRCNVVQAGQQAYGFNASTAGQSWKLVGGPTWGLLDLNTESILLTDRNDRNTVSYAFLKQQINMGTGFVAEFEFSTSPNDKAEGFVFVVQRDSIVNRNGGSGGHLGFRNTQDSIGIVFDLCADRNANPSNPSCALQEVRLHAARFNNASDETRKLRAPLYYPNNLNNGQKHRVTIRYFAIPAWFEVLIDDDLFLQKRNFDLDEFLGGRNAFVGFTASTGPFVSASLRIWDFQLKTVAVKASNSRLVMPEAINMSVIADGRRVYTSQVATYDFCDNKIQFGGLASSAGAVLVDPTNATRRVPARAVIDDDSGVYTAEFAYNEVGTFDLVAWFGDNSTCGETALPSETCFKTVLSTAVTFVPPDPVAPNNAGTTLSLQDQILMGFGIAAGIVLALGLCAIMYVLPARKQWLRDKKYIAAGKLAAMEKNIQYEGDIQIEMMAQRLQRVLEAISRARANRSLQQEIEDLLTERGELEESIRIMKEHKQELQRAKGRSSRRLNLSFRSASKGRSSRDLAIPAPPA